MTPYFDRDGIVIYNARCEDVLPDIDPASVDLLLTDPPYNVTENNGRDGTTVGKVKRADGSYREVRRDFGEWDREFDPSKLLAHATRLLVDRGGFLAFTSDRLIGAYVADPSLHHMRTLVWLKTNPAPQFPGNYQSSCEWVVWQGKGGPPTFTGGGAVPNVHRAAIPATSRRSHPNAKPLSLIIRLLGLHSKPGDLVLDPYMGSGPIAQACHELGRRYIGIELVEDYCKVAVSRLAQQTLDLSGGAA